jgi:preprotein translocase subunit SecA
MDLQTKEFVISKAATSGQITLSTAIFGRGTDFFCKCEKVEKAGGVHIIQAFLSTEASEEVQIKGRTARQGKKKFQSLFCCWSRLNELIYQCL